MSPRKLTEDDKQEILYQYRNSEATTSTLAQSFEVSSSTISRFLKNNLSTVEYEDLIQQKRLARTPRGEKSASPTDSQTAQDSPESQITAKSTSRRRRKTKVTKTQEEDIPELAIAENLQLELATASTSELDDAQPIKTRRRRRRSSAVESEPETSSIITPELEETEEPLAVTTEENPPKKLILDRQPTTKPEAEEPAKSDRLILKSDRSESEDDEEDTTDIMTLKEMLGEDLEDINDEEDNEDEDVWEEDGVLSYGSNKAELSDISILPLSQASLPRICYLVIDRSAELIVKPLADFADLGIIPEAEIQQRTLPVFDNHRIAKRFSHRRERVIKVPDGQMLQKTSQHLQDKGITRLLIDGQIYSLSN